MAEHKDDDALTKALGVAIALGALAVGVGAALANNERTRQMRAEMKQRLDELGRRVDDLSAEAQRRAGDLASQAQHVIEDRRPEIEQTIQRTREAVTQGLDKARTAVEQGAEKAQEYVQKVSSQVADKAGEATDSASGVIGVAASDLGDNAGNLAETARDTAGDLGERAGEMVEDASDTTGDLAEGTKARLQDAGSVVHDWTGEAGQQLSEMLTEAGERASDVGQQATSTVRDWTSTTFESADESQDSKEGSDATASNAAGETEDEQSGQNDNQGNEGEQGNQEYQGSQYTEDEGGGYTQGTLGDLSFDGGGGSSTDNPDMEDANANIYSDYTSGDTLTAGAPDPTAGESMQGAMSDVGGTAGDSAYEGEQASETQPTFQSDDLEGPDTGASRTWDTTPINTIGTAPLMENLGTAGIDSLRGDDLSTSSERFAEAQEDMSGEGSFTEQSAGESGFQMEGYIHSHESGGTEGGGTTDTTEQGNGDVERVDYDTQTGGLISSGRAGWANTSELGDTHMGGEAGGAGAPEFGSGGDEESEGSYGNSGDQPDFSRGQQTIPFRSDDPTGNLEVDNEPPHPGDTSTTDRS